MNPASASRGATARAARQASLAPPPTVEHGDDAVYDAIIRALLEGRLPAGTPLRERYLAEVFGVTRGAVRKVLLRLGQEGKLTMLPNRGAYVPEPSPEDIRTVYEARKAVEAGLVAVLAHRLSSDQLAQLRAHVRSERRAQRQGRRDESVRLAGAFHIELVNALGNAELAGIVERLVARTRLFVALFEPAHDSGCAPDEHETIVEALASADPTAVAAAMLRHLEQVEQRVLGRAERRAPPDLATILRASLEAQSR